MKKIIILILGTAEENDKFFYDEYKECILNTWAKNVPENIQVIYYHGGTETKFENGILTLPVEDDMKNVYKKTYFALDYINKHFEYDFVFRTNTSTYINTYLLNLFIDNIYQENYQYGSDIYSLSEGYVPYPLIPFRRGNGILFSKNDVDFFLSYGINLLYLGICDDTAIGNVFNSYLITQSIRDQKKWNTNIKGLPHAWYKSTDLLDNIGHQLSSFNNSDKYWMCITTTVKRYREREIEFDQYKEFHNLILNLRYPDEKIVIDNMRKYSENYSIFIGSILGYMDYEKWKHVDKNQLYFLEISNKAADDEQYYLREEIQGKFEKIDLSKI